MSLRTLLSSALATTLLAGSASAITIFGLGAGGQLYSFDTASPGTVTAVGSATAGGIVDIDFRGSNNRLYGITSEGTTSTINTTTGSLSLAFTAGSSLSGVSGFDFNPAADRMRIAVGGTTNFRMVPDGISPGTGTTAAGFVIADGSYSLPVGVTSILDVAYTNPFNGGLPTTTLYSIGSNGTLYSHSGAPQFNTMTAVGTGLGVALGSDIGFDIDSSGIGYIVSGTSLYTVDLSTGVATSAGTLGTALTSIAVIPEPSSMLLGSIAALGLLRRKRDI